MTDIAKARDAAIEAETRVEHFFNQVLDRLHWLNHRLAQLHDDIKAAQPVASGTVCLELYPCGPGCLGCPHPRWIRYRWVVLPQAKTTKPCLVGTNLDAANKDPVLALARSAPNYEGTVALVREAKELVKERKNLLLTIRSLKNATKTTS